MNDMLIFRGCADESRQQARDYWARKRRRLDHLLRAYPADVQHLRLLLRRTSAERYEAKVTLSLPGRTLVARAEGGEVHEALDRAADTLVREVRRHHDARTTRRARVPALV